MATVGSLDDQKMRQVAWNNYLGEIERGRYETARIQLILYHKYGGAKFLGTQAILQSASFRMKFYE